MDNDKLAQSRDDEFWQKAIDAMTAEQAERSLRWISQLPEIDMTIAVRLALIADWVKQQASRKMQKEETSDAGVQELLHIGDSCEVIEEGLYKGIRVKIVDLPDKYDPHRYSVSRDGWAGLRFRRDELLLIERAQQEAEQ